MTEKRFTTDNGSNEDVTLVDNVTGKEYESNFDEIVDLLNKQHEDILFNIKLIDNQQDAIGELKEENERLKQAIVETEKLIQSTYDELTKLRCFKKNILRIKHSWDYLMEAIQYD